MDFISQKFLALCETRWTPPLRSDTEKKMNQEFKKNYVTRLGFEPATSCVAFGYSNYLVIDPKKNNQEFKKNLTFVRFEPLTSSVAGG